MSLPPTEPPGLPIWVVYDHPLDWPDNFVARLWKGERPTGDLVVAFDLDGLREFLAAAGLVRLERMDGDDPAILETWLEGGDDDGHPTDHA